MVTVLLYFVLVEGLALPDALSSVVLERIRVDGLGMEDEVLGCRTLV
jgi:hypothetical protein